MKKNMTRKLLGMALTGALALTTHDRLRRRPRPDGIRRHLQPPAHSQSTVQETAEVGPAPCR